MKTKEEIILFYSDTSTKTSLRLLKYIRLALKYPQHEIKLLEMSEQIAQQYAQQFGDMADVVEVMVTESDDAMIQSKSISQEVIEKFKQLKEEKDNVTIQIERQKARRDQLGDKIAAEKVRIEKIEADRKVLLNKYLEASNTEVYHYYHLLSSRK